MLFDNHLGNLSLDGDWVVADDSHEYADSLVNKLDENKNKTWYSEEYNSNNAPQEGVKLGDLFIPWDAQHQVYSYTDSGWFLISDVTRTTINSGLITSGTIQLGDTETTAKAGITGGGTSEESVRIWAGAGNVDRNIAPFRVLQSGMMIASNAIIKGQINAESGTFGSGPYAFNIGKVSESGFEIPSIENNATSTSRMTITPYYVEYSAKKGILNEEIGEWEYTEYGTNIRIGAQLGDGFINSTQLEVITKDLLDSTNTLSHNASIKITCEGVSAYEGTGDVGEAYGNHAIMIEKGNICGLRLQSRRFSYTQTLTLTSGTSTATVKNANLLSKYDSVVITMASMTLVLPHDVEDGQIYYIKPYTGTARVIVHPLFSHHIMSQRTLGTSKELSSGAINVFIFDAQNSVWHQGYLT